jgi:hypothetical protein
MSLEPILVAALLVTATASAQSIPKEIWGNWTIQRQLPTRTISCWGDSDAEKLIGTQIEYSDKVFRWERTTTPNPVAEVKTVTAEQFRAQNSSPSSNGSQIDFHQLGIGAAAKEISIQHKPANITGATVEIPGDDVLVKNPDTIVFSVCSLYFEARRNPGKK